MNFTAGEKGSIISPLFVIVLWDSISIWKTTDNVNFFPNRRSWVYSNAENWFQTDWVTKDVISSVKSLLKFLWHKRGVNSFVIIKCLSQWIYRICPSLRPSNHSWKSRNWKSRNWKSLFFHLRFYLSCPGLELRPLFTKKFLILITDWKKNEFSG